MLKTFIYKMQRVDGPEEIPERIMNEFEDAQETCLRVEALSAINHEKNMIIKSLRRIFKKNRIKIAPDRLAKPVQM